MARLAIFEQGRPPEDEFVSDVRRMLTYRPELFGRAFSEALQAVMRRRRLTMICARSFAPRPQSQSTTCSISA